MSGETYIHPTAIVDEGATLGPGTKVWHFCHVSPGAKIGARCSLGQNCYVGSRVVIGDNARIQNNVSIYDLVTLEDDVFLGPSMVFTNVLTPRAAFPRKDGYAPTIVRKGATIGANATVVCGHEVGEAAMVAAGAVVTHDVLPFSLVAGVPARHIGWVCRCGERLKDGPAPTCATCRRAYSLEAGRLAEIPPEVPPAAG